MPKIEISLKSFLDKKSQKQPLCYEQDFVLVGALVGELALYICNLVSVWLWNFDNNWSKSVTLRLTKSNELNYCKCQKISEACSNFSMPKSKFPILKE